MVLSTDGNVSFCGLIYRNISKAITFPKQHLIGFDAGDRRRGVNLNIVDEENIEILPTMFELEGTNVFRIDGKIIARCFVII